MSICRCCGLLPHPFRRLPTSSIRSFATTPLLEAGKNVPAAREWGSKPKTDSTGGDLAGLSKWTRRPDDSPKNRGGDKGSGGGGAGGFGMRDRSSGGGMAKSDRGPGGGGGGWGKRTEAGGLPGMSGMSKWARSDDLGSTSRNNDRRESKGSGFGLRGSSGGDEKREPSRPGREGSSFVSREVKATGGTRRGEPLDKAEGETAARPSESVYDDVDTRPEGSGARSRRRHEPHVSRAETEEGFAFVRGKQPKRNSPYDKLKEKPQSEHERKAQHQAKERQRKLRREEEKKVLIPSSVTVSRLASIFGRKLYHVQNRMQKMGMSSEKLRPDYILNEEEACDIALEFGFNPTVDDEAAFDLLPEPEKPGEVHPLRPPVVTIMGHVDHGKTTLLDALRNTAVAAGEAGGITQHIGAFSVPLKSLLPADAPPTDATITFLDTPGHAAFTGMRARGASVTDIVVLVVAADDGVMPQTKEVIELVKAEGDNVGLVVAINKIDKLGIDLERVRSELLTENVYLEEDGGDVQSVKVSGLSRIGLDDLVETLSTLAELRELRARRDGKAEGWVLESNVDRGIGRVATVLVTRGTLKVGAVVVAGQTMCKVRRMTDHTGNTVTSAGPGTPVVITGWKEIPKAGDELLEAPNGEAEAKKVVANRIAQEERKKLLADAEVINVKRREDRDRLDAEHEEEEAIRKAGGNVFEAKLAASRRAAAKARENEFKELRVVIKGDVSGTVEAVEGVLSGIGNKEAGVKIISTGVGEVTESDIAMAEAAEALVIGFNVSASRAVKQSAAQAKVDLHLESVIYRLIETVREKTAALLPPSIESRTIGEGTVIQNFTINVGKRQTVTIAGARCVNGTINRHDKIRILRGPERKQVYQGVITTLKHLKTEVDEVRKGMECGIQLEGFDGMQEGDEIVTYKTFEVPRKL